LIHKQDEHERLAQRPYNAYEERYVLDGFAETRDKSGLLGYIYCPATKKNVTSQLKFDENKGNALLGLQRKPEFPILLSKEPDAGATIELKKEKKKKKKDRVVSIRRGGQCRIFDLQ